MKTLYILGCLTIQNVSSGSLGFYYYKQFSTTEFKINEALNRQMHQQIFHITKMERSLSHILAETPYKSDKEDYVSSPVTALAMVRRLARDWTALTGMARGLQGDRIISSLGNVHWPNGNDLEAVTKGVVRAQYVYNIGTEIMVQEPPSNSNTTQIISAIDGFLIAKAYVKKHFYSEALSWLQYSLGKSSSSLHQQSALHYLAAALCYSGKSEECQHFLLKMLRKDTKSKTSMDLAIQYFNISRKNPSALKESANYLKNIDEFGRVSPEEMIETHRKLCQGRGKTDDGLVCRYVHHNQPHLRLQPFKLEELQLDPSVIRFHDAITDMEAENMIELAKKVINPSQTAGENGPKISDYRKSFSVFLFEEGEASVRSFIRKLRLRMTDMTGLDTEYADGHQVASYALSGEYKPHHDYLLCPFQYNRLATLMYYLTDVKEGGNTVFLKWNLSVAPIKNSAILWYNFRPDGSLEEDSLHSGCPVLRGKKWVLNKWIWNLAGRPCPRNYNEYNKHFYNNYGEK